MDLLCAYRNYTGTRSRPQMMKQMHHSTVLRDFLRARLPLIISFHIKPKYGRTTGIEYPAMCQRLLVGRSTQGITPVPYRGVRSLQVNQTGLRDMQQDQTYYM